MRRHRPARTVSHRGAQSTARVFPLTNGGEDANQVDHARRGIQPLCQHFSPNQRWSGFPALGANNPALAKVYVVHADGNGWVAMTEGPCTWTSRAGLQTAGPSITSRIATDF